MAREVPWLEIRRVWETTLIGDAELATRFGFNSKNSVWRRRTSEGWTRDEKAIEAALAQRAVAGMAESVTEAGDVTPGHTERSHDQTQQTRAPEAQTTAGVTAEKGADTSLSGQAGALARRETPDEMIEDWTEVKVKAKRRHLRFALKMQSMSARLLDALEGVLEGPALRGGEQHEDDWSNTPYGLAIITLRAINPDKDTLNGLTKAAMDGMYKGVELERLVLGLDLPDGTAAGPANLPPGIVSADELVSMSAKNIALLEAISDMAAEAEQKRPTTTIDGQSERVR